jgi:Arc/MetJ-type ribon-helix-helix transcriptional regulator
MPARTVTLELSEEQARWVDERVAEGAYPDTATAVADALEDRMIQEAIRSGSLDAATAVQDRADNDPAGDVDLDEYFDGVASRLAEQSGG